MNPQRRGILLGLGFSIDALRAAGVTDAELDAIASPQVSVGGDGSDISDVTFEFQRNMIDVTSHNDARPQFVPGVARGTVTFKISLRSAEMWRHAIVSGEPMIFDEVVGNQRMSCRLRVVEFIEQCPVDGDYTATVRAHVDGAPSIQPVVKVAPAPPATEKTKRTGRRGMKLHGAIIDSD